MRPPALRFCFRCLPAVLERPDALTIQPARPDQQRAESADADLDRSLAEKLPRRRAHRGDCV